MIFTCSNVALAQDVDNKEPMYGGNYTPEVKLDPKFSKHASELGWKYFYNGDSVTAMKRFNQAWMSDNSNASAYWGFGVLMGLRAKQENEEKNLEQSIKFLNKANELDPKNAGIKTDLAYSYTCLYAFFKNAHKITKSDVYQKSASLFEEAKLISPEYPLLYANWSVLEFEKGNFVRARELLDEAKAKGFVSKDGYEDRLNKAIQ